MNINPATEKMPPYNHRLQIPTLSLFCFNSLKQCLEIACSKTLEQILNIFFKYMPCFNIFCGRLKGSLKKKMLNSLFHEFNGSDIITDTQQMSSLSAQKINIKGQFYPHLNSFCSPILFLVFQHSFFVSDHNSVLFKIQFSHTSVFPQYFNVCLS